MRIWEFTEYRAYLTQILGDGSSRSGKRKMMAEAIGVHTTYVSQVLKGPNEFSLEQAELINIFLQHSDDEGEYFVLLVSKARAGHSKLKSRFESQIQKMRDQRLNIQNRLNSTYAISAKDRERFYSSAIYGAIHVLASIPEFNSVTTIAQVTRLPQSKVQEIVDFMIGIGVLNEVNGKISSGSNHVHLGNDSEVILKHHINWRLHTISNLQFIDRDDIHYSACLSLSKEDAFRVKESILANLKTNVDIVTKSKEELAYVMCLDFYKL